MMDLKLEGQVATVTSSCFWKKVYTMAGQLGI